MKFPCFSMHSLFFDVAPFGLHASERDAQSGAPLVPAFLQPTRINLFPRFNLHGYKFIEVGT